MYDGAGGSSPPVPRGRGITPAPGMRQAYCNHHTLFRMKVEETKNSTTGTMKILKKVGWESELSHRSFFMFSPDALHPVDGILPPARVRTPVAHPTRKVTIFFCQRDFCVFLGGNTTIPQALRASFLYTREPFFSCNSGIFLFQREIVCQIRRETSATGSRGDTPGPLLGQGMKSLVGVEGAKPLRVLYVLFSI